MQLTRDVRVTLSAINSRFSLCFSYDVVISLLAFHGVVTWDV